MKHFIIFIAISILLLPPQAYPETLNEKVARNAANCLVGHITTNSKKYQSGKTSKYMLLIEKTVGPEQVMTVIEEATNNFKASVRFLGSDIQEEGQWLKDTFCPGVDSILNNSSKG